MYSIAGVIQSRATASKNSFLRTKREIMKNFLHRDIGSRVVKPAPLTHTHGRLDKSSVFLGL